MGQQCGSQPFRTASSLHGRAAGQVLEQQELCKRRRHTDEHPGLAVARTPWFTIYFARGHQLLVWIFDPVGVSARPELPVEHEQTIRKAILLGSQLPAISFAPEPNEFAFDATGKIVSMAE